MQLWFPIERRELGVLSRRWTTYLRRVIAPAAALAFIFLAAGEHWAEIKDEEKGLVLFMITAWTAFVYTLLGGFVLTADCISREKRENTLGLLFLTDLRSHDVVLGKWVSHSIVALGGLVAALPLLMMPVLLGGVALPMIGKTAATLLLTMLLSLATGIFASSLFSSSRLAMTLALVLLVFFSLGGFMAAILGLGNLSGAGTGGMGKINAFLFSLSPLATMLMAQESTRSGIERLLPSWERLFIAQLGLTAALMIAASYFTGRFWHERKPWKMTMWHRLRYWLVFGPQWYRRRVREHWFERDPVTWMIVRPWFKSIAVWITVLVFLPFFVLFTVINPDSDFLWFAWMALGAFKIAWALESAQGLAHEIRQEEMESLLGTPWQSSEYIASHWRALRALFARPLAALMLFTVVIFFFSGALGKGKAFLADPVPDWDLVLNYAGLWLMFGLDIWALGWVGLWQGLRSRHPKNGGMNAILLILGVPWILAAACYQGVLIWAYHKYARYFFGVPLEVLHQFLFLLSLAISGGLGGYARWKVRSKFRTLALQHRYGQGKRPLWKRLSGLWQAIVRRGKPAPAAS